MRIRCVRSPYRLTQKYGYDKDYPLNNGMHYGVDYVSEDRKIVAPQDSVVIGIGSDKINGNYLVLRQGKFRDWFSHIKSYNVALGDTVKTGQHVAIMGNTGYSTGVHVHHSLRVDGKMEDAEKYIMSDALTKEECNAMYMLAFDVNLASVNKDFVKAFTGKPAQEALTYLLQDKSYQEHKKKVNTPSEYKKVQQVLYEKVSS